MRSPFRTLGYSVKRLSPPQVAREPHHSRRGRHTVFLQVLTPLKRFGAAMYLARMRQGTTPCSDARHAHRPRARQFKELSHSSKHPMPMHSAHNLLVRALDRRSWSMSSAGATRARLRAQYPIQPPPAGRRLLDELSKDSRGTEFTRRPGSFLDLLNPKLEFLKQVKSGTARAVPGSRSGRAHPLRRPTVSGCPRPGRDPAC